MIISILSPFTSILWNVTQIAQRSPIPLEIIAISVEVTVTIAIYYRMPKETNKRLFYSKLWIGLETLDT